MVTPLLVTRMVLVLVKGNQMEELIVLLMVLQILIQLLQLVDE